MSLSFLKLRPAKIDEISPEAQVGMLSSIIHMSKRSFMDSLLLRSETPLSFEIASLDQKTMFYIAMPEEAQGYLNSQILSHYPKTLASFEHEDPLTSFIGDDTCHATVSYAYSYSYPMKTFRGEHETSPLVSILGYFSKLNPGEQAYVQLAIQTPSQGRLQRTIRNQLKTTDSEGVEKANEYQHIINQKLTTPLMKVQMRFGVRTTDITLSQSRLAEMAGSLGVYTLSEGNSLVHSNVGSLKKKGFLRKLSERTFYRFQPTMIMNLEETASLWHLPDNSFESIRLIDWGKTLLSEAPEHLPVAELITEEYEKKEHNFFAKTEWRNHEAIFGINRSDRRRHLYLIGKTGTGKSTLIGNMAINDIRNGEGIALIDPHGDTSEALLNYIPKRRINDVIYLDPSLSSDRSFALNLFDSDGGQHMDVVASGIVSIFYKLYRNSWGPRLEYILRNTIITLLLYEEATFIDLPRILTNKKFRDKVVDKIKDKDPVLTAFWREEFDKMTDKLRVESISSILNKVGQFLSSQFVRNAMDSKKSTFSLQQIMDEGKILILNLSQGKLGEDAAALLGAMFITKIQLTAMNRVHIPEEERKDFYLYVDEFQNFATTSFIKILSEARKYRLNLILANQYIGQVEEDIQKAIFGNVGSLMSFVVGAHDASLLEKEFGGVFTADDLVGLGRYETLMKMAIDDLTSAPFMAKTLPPPSVMNNNKEKIIRVGLERYYRAVT